MAERDVSQRVTLNSDVPGDREKLRVILTQWGLEQSSIRRVLSEHHVNPAADRATVDAGRAPQPQRDAGH